MDLSTFDERGMVSVIILLLIFVIRVKNNKILFNIDRKCDLKLMTSDFIQLMS